MRRRRGNFLIVALVALLTFTGLQAVIGNRGRYGYGGRHGYYERHHECYENNSRSNEGGDQKPQHNEGVPPAADSAY